MAEWVISIVVSTISGSMLYVIWRIAARFFKREEFLNAMRYGIHLVILFFFIISLVSMGVFFYIKMQPGKFVWFLYTIPIRNIFKGLFIIWTGGVIFKVCLYMLRFHRLRKLSKTYIPCDLSVRRLFESLCNKMEIKKNILLVQSMAVPVARMEGIFYPRICIPIIEYEEGELQIILKHELAHYRNNDRWIRGCAILLECIYWFNPIVEQLHHSLESWDEYYCDYMVCNKYGVNAKDYMNELLVMVDRIMEWNKKISDNMFTAFIIKRKNLKGRIERIMKYTGQGKQKKGFSVVFCGLFVFAGCMMTFFSGIFAKVAYAKMLNITYEDNMIVETGGDEVDLEEYVMSQEEIYFISEQSMGDGIIVHAEPTAVISTTLQDEIWRSGKFKAYSDQNIFVSVTGTPSNVKMKVGIVEPDGVWRVVYSSGNITHTFKLTKSGDYDVFVWNETDTEVKVVGHYATTDSE